ncbi:MAG: hypothetical protein BWY06_02711 [Candidatus Latescibacteria bacterium ADurb.Bin168]|nr:MAG: hypothetical protein BWY06_02711 [Candidatus Latescibacteria bacterium ADurb.Bin168]
MENAPKTTKPHPRIAQVRLRLSCAGTLVLCRTAFPHAFFYIVDLLAPAVEASFAANAACAAARRAIGTRNGEHDT